MENKYHCNLCHKTHNEQGFKIICNTCWVFFIQTPKQKSLFQYNVVDTIIKVIMDSVNDTKL